MRTKTKKAPSPSARGVDTERKVENASVDRDNELLRLHRLSLATSTPTESRDPSQHEGKPQDTLLSLVNTTGRGYDLVTRTKIKAGTLLLAEPSLISLSKAEEDDSSAVEREFAALSGADQKQYLQLFDARKSRMSRVVSIYYSNCYNCEGFKRDGTGGSAVGALASRINHGCVPNVQFSHHEATNEMRFHALKDIPRGKPLLSNYDKAVFETRLARQRKQQIYYGFVCRCEACEPKSEFWARSDERRRAMLEAMRVLQLCERRYPQHAETGEGSSPEWEARRTRFVDDALAALIKLEGLLLKEGLVGVPLANTYRSLAKWAERIQATAQVRLWKEKELQACILCLGVDAVRTKDIEQRLAEARTKPSLQEASVTMGNKANEMDAKETFD